jgi:hypothetical protein
MRNFITSKPLSNSIRMLKPRDTEITKEMRNKYKIIMRKYVAEVQPQRRSS